MATSNGGTTADTKVTLDDLATAHFRGILGENSIRLLSRARGLLLQREVPAIGSRLLARAAMSARR